MPYFSIIKNFEIVDLNELHFITIFHNVLFLNNIER